MYLLLINVVLTESVFMQTHLHYLISVRVLCCHLMEAE